MKSQVCVISDCFILLIPECLGRLRQENHWKFEASWANNEFQNSLGYSAGLHFKYKIKYTKKARWHWHCTLREKRGWGWCVLTEQQRWKAEIADSPFPNPVSEGRDMKDSYIQAAIIPFILPDCSASCSTVEIPGQKQKSLAPAWCTVEPLRLLSDLAFPTLLFPFLLFYPLHLQTFCIISTRTFWYPPASHRWGLSWFPPNVLSHNSQSFLNLLCVLGHLQVSEW